MIFPTSHDFGRGDVPPLDVKLDFKDALLAEMKAYKPVAVAAGYVRDYRDGSEGDIVDALYEANGCRWTDEMTYNIKHNDMEVDPEFVKAMIGE